MALLFYHIIDYALDTVFNLGFLFIRGNLPIQKYRFPTKFELLTAMKIKIYSISVFRAKK